MDARNPSEGQRRLAAIVALIALAGAILIVLRLALIDPLDIALMVLGLVVALGGMWLALVNRGAIRVLGGLLVTVGILGAIGILIDSERHLLGVLVAVALATLAGLSARFATRRLVTSLTAADLGEPAPPAKRPVLIVNPHSGGGKSERDLADECRRRGITLVVLAEGDDLVALARDAIESGADALGMAGGDGSQALVAAVAHEHGVPFVVVPAGTRNHLALDLGLDRADVVGALDAFAGGVPRTIDLARVNGRVFVNNASLGLYAEIVSSDAYRDAKLRTTFEALPDLLGPDADSVDLRIVDPDDRTTDAGHVLLISNNPYAWDTLSGVGTRARLDTGELGVVSLTLATPADARQFLALETAHQVGRFSGWKAWTTPEVEVTSGGVVPIALDGEALTMTPPLHFEIVPRALTVLLPPHAPGRSPAARTLGWGIGRELWDLARGRDPRP